MKVYLVTEGTYSDYRVTAVFSSKEKAEEYMETFPSHYYNNLKEYELDPNAVELHKEGYSNWYVRMDGFGNTATVYDEPTSNQATYESVFRTKKWFVIRCIARSEEHAIKIANERRIALLASGELIQ